MSDKFTLYNHERGNSNEFEKISDAKEQRQSQIGLGATPEQLEIFPPGESPGEETVADGGTETIEPEVVDNTTEPEEPPQAGYELPEKPRVDEDPMSWMPSDFTDTIEGTEAINRKGYEVMAHHYGIGTSSNCLVGPEETDFDFCRVEATATTEDGVEYTAHGSAHVDRGDDSYLLLEMADTRARKRAIAQATGVGMVAVEELQNEVR